MTTPTHYDVAAASLLLAIPVNGLIFFFLAGVLGGIWRKVRP